MAQKTVIFSIALFFLISRHANFLIELSILTEDSAACNNRRTRGAETPKLKPKKTTKEKPLAADPALVPGVLVAGDFTWVTNFEDGFYPLEVAADWPSKQGDPSGSFGSGAG